MIYPVYAIRDSRVGFMTPTLDQNDPAATRNFAHAAMEPSSLMHSHPSDFDLYRVGEFDTDSGEIKPCVPSHVVSAVEVLNGD